MKLRNQIILAFFLFSVLPLTGVTLYSYYSSRAAFRQAVEAQTTVRARDMERRMGEITDDLQHRIERVSDLPYWDSLAPGAERTGDWNEFMARLQTDLGSAAGLVDRIEFHSAGPLVPAAPGSRAGQAEIPPPEGEASAPTVVYLQFSDATELEREVVVTRVGDKLMVQHRSAEVFSGEEDGPLHRVAQLAHVAGPLMVHVALQDVVVDLEDRLALLLAKALHVVPDELRDVIATVAQGRQKDLHHVEAEVEIAPERAGLHGSLQIGVGRGHQA